MGSLAAAAAAAAAARRAGKGPDAITALEQKRAAAAAAGPGGGAAELQAALQGRRGQLRPVDGAGQGGGAAGGGLEAALRQGLQKFRFDDDNTGGTTLHEDLTAPHPLRD
jgi:hypothetical protein